MVAILGAAHVAYAATDTWTGNLNANWNNAGNWTGGNAPPQAGDSLVFGSSAFTTLNNDLMAGTAVNGLTFSGGTAFTLNGDGILLSGSVNGNSTGLANNSGVAQTIGTMPLTLDRGYYTFSSPLGGSLALNGSVALNPGGVAYFDANVTSTSLTTDSAGLIAGLGGAGLMYGTTAAPAGGLGPTSLATISGGAITALASYTPYASGAIASGQNLEFTASGAGAALTAAAGTTVNTITVDQAGNSGGTATTTLAVAAGGTLTFNDHGGVYVLRSGTGVKSCFTLSSGSGGYITAGNGTAPAAIVVAVNGDNAANQGSITSVIKDNTGSGPVSVILSGTGAVVINGVNTYSGGLYINQGQFQGNTTSVGLGPVYVASGATAYLNGAGTYGNNIYISPGYGTLVQTTTNANPGAIFLSGSGAAGFSGTLTLQGAAVPVTSAGSVAGDRLTGGNIAGNTYTFAGQITGTGTLDLNASIRGCTMLLTNTSTLTPNNWQGGLIIEESLAAPTSARNIIVKLGADNQIPSGANAGDIALYSADTTSSNSLVRLDLNGHTNTINGLYAVLPPNGYPVQVANFGGSNSLLTLGANNANGNFSGVMNDNGAAKSLSLVKIGSGTQTFNEPLNYNGSTTVSNGTLALSGSATMANTPAISVAAGATLDASGIAGLTVGAAQTLAGRGMVKGETAVNGKLSPFFGGIGTLANAGDVAFNSSGTYVWSVNSAAGTAGADPGWGLLNVTGGLSFAAGSTVSLNSLTLGDASGPVADFDNTRSYTWHIARASGGISGFNPGSITLSAAGFANSLGRGAFILTTNATDLLLSFAVPPAITAIQVNTAGNSVAISGTNGPPNVGFRVLTSADVTAHVATWTELGTGTFSGSGSFSFSGAITPTDTQRFYVVVAP